MENNLIPRKLLRRMFKERVLRKAITKESHFLFFHFYFPHYVQFETAPFQREIFALTEDESIPNVFIVAFRGSAKSTIVTTSYPIWAILGKQHKKFVLLLCQTVAQAKQHMTNLKCELESNQLLRNDLGPFREERDEWGTASLVFSRQNARITAVSTEQTVRGLRHNQYRPDLIIGDDLEDLSSTKTYEGRKKTYDWLTGEVIQAGDRDTRLLIIGNLLHEDSLLMRLKENLQEGLMEGVFKEYPLLDENGQTLWPGKFPDQAAIDKEKKKAGNEYAWQREYLLKIVRDEDQVIRPEWIQYYDDLPPRDQIHGISMGVDLAISSREIADYTAVVSAIISYHDSILTIYILPDPLNKRLEFPQIIEQIKATYTSLKPLYSSVKILVENVGFQLSVVHQLNHDHYPAEAVSVSGDKRARLMSTGDLIKSSNVLFPRHGAEELIRQIIGLGLEKHDDLVDAFTLIVNKAIEKRPCEPHFFIL